MCRRLASVLIITTQTRARLPAEIRPLSTGRMLSDLQTGIDKRSYGSSLQAFQGDAPLGCSIYTSF